MYSREATSLLARMIDAHARSLLDIRSELACLPVKSGGRGVSAELEGERMSEARIAIHEVTWPVVMGARHAGDGNNPSSERVPRRLSGKLGWACAGKGSKLLRFRRMA